MKPLRVLAVLAAVSLAGAGSAGAQPDRQRASFLFDEDTPGATTGLRLQIDYVNPADPAAKPFAVQTVVEALAPGASIDTSVPARCAATDAQLTTQGASACPAASRVGEGEVDLDTGIAGPGRIVANRVTQFNADGQLILLLEQPGGSRAVSRARVEGRTIRAESPPLPGGPPDGFTAIKRVRLRLRAISNGGRSYVRTPGSCPAGGWVNQISFAYRDGVTQIVPSRSGCRANPGRAPVRTDRVPPRLTVSGVPTRCASRSFFARVRIRDSSSLRRATVRLDRRLVRTTRRKRFRVRIAVRGLRPGSHRLTVAARDRSGNRGVRVLRFRRCGRAGGG